MMQDAKNRLLPEPFLRPVMLLFAGVLPQLLLLLLNLRAHALVGGELGPAGRVGYGIVFGAQAVLFLALVAAWAEERRGRAVGVLTAALLFVLHGAYLWAVCLRADALVPPSVAAWMLNAGQLLFVQFALIAPLLFYTLVRLAGWGGGRIRPIADLGVSVAVLLGIPLFWMLIGQVLAHAGWIGEFMDGFFFFVFFISTAVMLLAFLRMLLWGYAAAGQSLALLIVASLVLPLAGLLLNRVIPFPCDLQDVRVYGLTVLNAAVLCLPFARLRARPGAGWMAAAVLYPFTLYFFLVFLPFLPLSIPAMLAVGGGFLVLAPTVLFVVHTRRLCEEGRVVAARWGGRRAVLGFLALLLVMPAIYTGDALWQRRALNRAIAAVFSPDYTTRRLPLDRGAAGRALRRLRRTKQGLYLPFLSEYYNRVVFNGMTLPDHKIETMERLLFDREPGERQEARGWRGDDFFTLFTGANVRRADWTGRAMPARDVRAAVAVSAKPDGALVRAEATLTMTNGAPEQAEFVGVLTVPDGVVVSGFWLEVAGQRVPGRIFDRKTAAWVYHMIRDEQRLDPGLLQYKTEKELELRVFPFAPGEVRQCGIEFLYPAGARPWVEFGGDAVALGAEDGAPAVVTVTATDRSASVFIPGELAAGLPSVRRKPYLHFLVDVSGAAAESYPLYGDMIRGALARTPGVGMARVELVNHESVDLAPQRIPARDAAALVDTRRPRRFTGGFWPGRAMRCALTEWSRGADAGAWTPVFVIVSGRERGAGLTPELGEFAALLPDSPRVYDVRDPIDWRDSAVILLACDDRLAPVSAERGGWALFGAPGDPVVLDGQGGRLALPGARRLAGQSVFALAAEGMALAAGAARAPHEADALRRDLLGVSRASGVLLPTTAYIVVENSAQWEFMERKERQALGAKGALEFDEFKQPVAVPDHGSTWPLLLLALLALGAGRLLSLASRPRWRRFFRDATV